MTKELKIEGMTCDHCVMHVKEALEGLDGVTDVNVESGKAEIEILESVELSSLYDAIEVAGYKLLNVS